MNLMEQYLEGITGILRAIAEKEQKPIEDAARLVASKVEKGKFVHVFASGGHSIMGAMEVF
jgi:uncharacterized phosphosugar-binding protein